MIQNQFKNITKDSTLGELKTFSEVIDASENGEKIASLFKEHNNLPGILVVDGDTFRGVISRDVFFEKTGRAFGIEIYLTRSIRIMIDEYPFRPLVLPATSHIGDAAERALTRPVQEVYEPIVVQWGKWQYSLLDVLTLFITQNYILQRMNAQRFYTIQNGLPLSDDEALDLFLHYVKKDRSQFQNLNQNYNVHCGRCGALVSYRIVDVIRSFPQIDKGVFQEMRMGSVFYTFYVRHRCGNQIVEIPVHHDDQLAYRNHKPLRIIESYV